MDLPLTPTNIAIRLLRGASWRDFNDFVLPDNEYGGVDTQAGVRMAENLARALADGHAAIVLGQGVVL